MQTYRLVPRGAAGSRACRAACASAASPCASPTQAAAASRSLFTTPFFHPYSHNNVANVGNYGYGGYVNNGGFSPVSELAPLFRVLDSAVAELTSPPEEEGQQQTSTSTRRRRHRHAGASFAPRFDVKEIGSTYELVGELPGLESKDLEIEFEDEKTLVIRGRSVRETESRSDDNVTPAVAAAPAPAVEAASTDDADAASEKSGGYQKASVADEDDDFVDAGAEAEAGSATGPTAEEKGKTPETTTSTTAEGVDTQQQQQQQQPAASGPQFKYWISERSVGEFERRFAFSGKVDQDAVTASLKNGILSVTVPKLVQASGARRIEIQ